MGASSLLHRFYTALRTHASSLHRSFFPPPVLTHPFDIEHGVDTSGLFFSDQLSSGHPNDDHINAYWGTPPSAFDAILSQWQQTLTGTAHTLHDFTFLDIGSGKGRVVMLASDFAFQRIVGVELSPAMAVIGQTNLATWSAAPHACTDITLLQMDALVTPIPDTPAVLYIYNAFNVYVMVPLLERLQALSLARTAPLDLIYAQPQQSALVDAVPGIQMLAASSAPLSPEDQSACAFATRDLKFRIYRFAGHQAASTYISSANHQI